MGTVSYTHLDVYKRQANHAVQELDSDAKVAWIALAQAFVNTDDATQAGTAIAVAIDRDEKLAARIGDKPEDWADAAVSYTHLDVYKRQSLLYCRSERTAARSSQLVRGT